MAEMKTLDLANLVFFLGGNDLEMQTIRALLEETAPGRFHDKHLRWGARASAYRQEIEHALSASLTPVLVELQDDLGLDPGRVVIVDHHGEQAGSDKPTSLQQIFALLGLPAGRWTRWFTLVAANDRGHIAEMLGVGATPEEIVRVRAADRAAQGISPEEERAGEEAVRRAETLAKGRGRLTLVRLPHDHTATYTATVTDRLDPTLGGPGFKNLVVLCPDEVNFFGSGDLVAAIDRRFPGGWYGGALPHYGFWGRAGSGQEVLMFLLDQLDARPVRVNMR
ncbi:MAG: hypothetical protein ACT4QB_10550 [Gammaproteobacteria bacterium]